MFSTDVIIRQLPIAHIIIVRHICIALLVCTEILIIYKVIRERIRHIWLIDTDRY